MSASSSVVMASDWCTEVHEFDSCQGLGFFYSHVSEMLNTTPSASQLAEEFSTCKMPFTGNTCMSQTTFFNSKYFFDQDNPISQTTSMLNRTD